MKYKLTWTDIFTANFYRFFVVGFPCYIFTVCVIGFIMIFFEWDIWNYSFYQYIVGFYEAFYTVIFIYLLLIVLLCILSWKYWKRVVMWEHELSITKDFFIWKSQKQEIKTKLNLLRKFKIRRNYILIKFEWIQTAKISKKWIISWYETFVDDMNQAYNTYSHKNSK